MNLQCSAGLPHTLDLKEEFYFNNENWTCDPISNLHERSSKRKYVYRDQDQNYNCKLVISDAQTSDSGSYECSVFVPGYDSPVMSRGVHLEVQSASLSTSGIISSALGAVVSALILLILIAVIAGVVYKRVHDGRDPERQPLLQPPQPHNQPPQPHDQPPQPHDQPPQPHDQPPQPQGPHGQPPQPQGPHGQPPQILHLSGDQQPHGKFFVPNLCIDISHQLLVTCMQWGEPVYLLSCHHSQVLMFLVAIRVSLLLAQIEKSSLVQEVPFPDLSVCFAGRIEQVSIYDEIMCCNHYWYVLCLIDIVIVCTFLIVQT